MLGQCGVSAVIIKGRKSDRLEVQVFTFLETINVTKCIYVYGEMKAYNLAYYSRKQKVLVVSRENKNLIFYH